MDDDHGTNLNSLHGGPVPIPQIYTEPIELHDNLDIIGNEDVLMSMQEVLNETGTDGLTDHSFSEFRFLDFQAFCDLMIPLIKKLKFDFNDICMDV